jgi:enoyl-CoA hydratase
MSDLVRRENSGGAATLTLNRPEKFNALSKDMFEALEVHVDALARETKTIGLVIMRGANGNFSAGYDMEEVLAHVKAHAKPHFHSEVIQKIANLPQPVISAGTALPDRWNWPWRPISLSPPNRRSFPMCTQNGA